MNLRVYDSKRNCTLMEKNYPEWFSSSDEGIVESTTSMEEYFGKGFYKEIIFEGVHIGFGDVFLRNAVQLEFESDFETIEMHFSLKGISTVSTSIADNLISFKPHQHNIVYANGLCGRLDWESEYLQLCEINMAPQFFKRYFPEGNHLFDTFRNSMEKGKTSLLSKNHYQVSHKMYQIVEEIIRCQRKGIFKRMFLEAKVIELLMLQLEQFADHNEIQTSVKKSDVDKIYAVREFILHNMDDSSSLIDLAHKVGTNEFILKKGFKELFGTTVFGFWNDVKMEEAKQLLMQKKMNVGEVSHHIGYKNQRHFSAAFKKKFGVLPSQYKKQ